MRIGIFTDTYPPYINGVSTSIAMLEKALLKKGHQVFIVTVNCENYSYNDDGRVLRIPSIPIGIYDYRISGVYPIKAVSIIKNWHLDVIHSQTEFGMGIFARIIAKQFKIPLVHTYHTMYEDYIHYITKGYFMGPSKKIVEHLTKFYCDKTATELIVPTQKAYNLFKEKYKVDRNIHIVPTGIEVERFYRENNPLDKVNNLRCKLNLTEDNFVILSLGRIAQEKSVDLLIEAHAKIVKKNNKAILIIVGDGPDLENYKKLACKLKIDKNVIFVGKVPWDDVNLYYQLADLFATASRTETQGLTVIEAMAASVPVVAANDESFRDVVVEDLNGKLFENKKEYINIIENLMSNRDKIKKMTTQARNTADMHSSKYFAEQALVVYRKAIGPQKKKTFKDKIMKLFKRR
ncbi:MAG: glycosyltransferase family 4 protein [Bacilli bacterium]|nr:glycosyltransferase family 4 protein [Bacilli bacterium]